MDTGRLHDAVAAVGALVHRSTSRLEAALGRATAALAANTAVPALPALAAWHARRVGPRRGLCRCRPPWASASASPATCRRVPRSRLVGDRYEGALVDAVRAFQDRHGLKADGVLGRDTLAELATPVSTRACSQIEWSLERLR